MKKALVTGIAGFAGSHLTEYLLSKNIQVSGFYHPDHSIKNIDHLKNEINLIVCDLYNERKVEKYFSENHFDYIFHLAASSSPAESLKLPKKTMENNIIGELNILGALSKAKSKARILIIGSAEEYGNGSGRSDLDENTPFAPQTPYAVSKIAQDLLGYQYFLHYKLDIVRVRPFNHIGPRQASTFVVSAFASRIAQAEKENHTEIKVGNLSTWRDFTDVRDMVRAYYLALEKGESGEVYNIGSSKLYKIADILKMLLDMSTVNLRVIEDKSLKRPEAAYKTRCNFNKFKKQTGWKPEIPIEKTLFDTISYERNNLK